MRLALTIAVCLALCGYPVAAMSIPSQGTTEESVPPHGGGTGTISNGDIFLFVYVFFSFMLGAALLADNEPGNDCTGTTLVTTDLLIILIIAPETLGQALCEGLFELFFRFIFGV